MSPPSGKYQPGVAGEDLALILTRTPADVWQALRGQRIFITGGTGFIGCWLLEALLWANQELALGLELTVLSRRPDAFRAKAAHLASHSAVRLVAGDVGDLSAISGPFDSIIHAATDVVNATDDPAKLFDSIVRGTEQTLALATRSHSRRYLLTSSGAVYGRQPAAMRHIPESYAGAPDVTVADSAYGQAKRVSEWMVSCQRQSQHLDAKVARCFAFVGPYMALDAQFAIGNFIRDSLQGGPVKVGGDGTPYRSYLYAADLAVWLLTILVNGDALPYNVGSAERITIGALARQVSLTLTAADRAAIAKPAAAGKPAEQYVPAIERAAALGLGEYTDLATAIEKTAAWHQRRTSGEVTCK